MARRNLLHLLSIWDQRCSETLIESLEPEEVPVVPEDLDDGVPDLVVELVEHIADVHMHRLGDNLLGHRFFWICIFI